MPVYYATLLPPYATRLFARYAAPAFGYTDESYAAMMMIDVYTRCLSYYPAMLLHTMTLRQLSLMPRYLYAAACHDATLIRYDVSYATFFFDDATPLLLMFFMMLRHAACCRLLRRSLRVRYTLRCFRDAIATPRLRCATPRARYAAHIHAAVAAPCHMLRCAMPPCARLRTPRHSFDTLRGRRHARLL